MINLTHFRERCITTWYMAGKFRIWYVCTQRCLNLFCKVMSFFQISYSVTLQKMYPIATLIFWGYLKLEKPWAWTETWLFESQKSITFTNWRTVDLKPLNIFVLGKHQLTQTLLLPCIVHLYVDLATHKNLAFP